MTRVNFGVHPFELCDQHLIAEYRELPRCFRLSPKKMDPGPFHFGEGHMLWCAQYKGSLAIRYLELVEEMTFRGFTVNFPDPAGDGDFAPSILLKKARIVTIERINERLVEMSPRWTKRSPPDWIIKP